MWTVTITANTNLLSALGTVKYDSVDKIFDRFYKYAGDRVLEEVHNILGSPGIYTLSADYAAKKPTLQGYKAVSGKAADQPLIFSGVHIYDALEITKIPGGVRVQIDPSKAIDDSGFNIAQYWADETEFMEEAMKSVEADLVAEFKRLILQGLGIP